MFGGAVASDYFENIAGLELIERASDQKKQSVCGR
jgi:hypothetical protein